MQPSPFFWEIEMQEQGVAATRQLAKRQFTWLRRETDAEWLYTEEVDVQGGQVANYLKTQLTSTN
jgi:tRNA A37 N6-isopentenylltransferase MiaA